MTPFTAIRTCFHNAHPVKHEISKNTAIVCRYAINADWYAYLSVQSEVAK